VRHGWFGLCPPFWLGVPATPAPSHSQPLFFFWPGCHRPLRRENGTCSVAGGGRTHTRVPGPARKVRTSFFSCPDVSMGVAENPLAPGVLGWSFCPSPPPFQRTPPACSLDGPAVHFPGPEMRPGRILPSLFTVPPFQKNAKKEKKKTVPPAGLDQAGFPGRPTFNNKNELLTPPFINRPPWLGGPQGGPAKQTPLIFYFFSTRAVRLKSKLLPLSGLSDKTKEQVHLNPGLCGLGRQSAGGADNGVGGLFCSFFLFVECSPYILPKPAT